MTIRPAAVSIDLQPLVELVRQFAVDEYGIALGGAHAKGLDDGHSDLDISLFARKWLPNEARDALCRKQLGEQVRVHSWSGQPADSEAGTDITFNGEPVECWLRNMDRVADAMDECLAGVVRRSYNTWTAMGYVNYGLLTDIHTIVILDDPTGLLAEWKARARVYPPKLRDAIIQQQMDAIQFWPGNLHLDSAITRRDTLYVAAISQQVVQNLVQIYFALNEVYFPGEKKLATSLAKLAYVPDKVIERLEQLAGAHALTDAASFEAHRELLVALVDDTVRLVDMHR